MASFGAILFDFFTLTTIYYHYDRNVIYSKRKYQMKKIALATILAVSAFAVSAASVTAEYQNANGVDGNASQQGYNLTVRGNVMKGVSADAGIQTRVSDSTDGISSTRLEAGLTGSTSLAPSLPFGVYTRIATGQKFTTTTNYAYYSVEPGVSMPFGRSGLTARVGWRYRAAYDTANADETKTWRAGLSYAVTKQDTVGVRYDRMRGDTNQNVIAVNYTRGF
jgi:hypothetical protein